MNLDDRRPFFMAENCTAYFYVHRLICLLVARLLRLMTMSIFTDIYKWEKGYGACLSHNK